MSALEHERDELALRRSELKYRTVADNTYSWEWWRAADGHYEYVSPSCERISGHSAEEFLADPELILAITHPDDVAELRRHLETDLAQVPSEFGLEFRIITASGDERVLQHLCHAVHGDDGAFLGRRGSNRDITAQKRTESALAERERMLSNLMSSLPGMAYRCATDDTWSMEFVSDGCEELTGYPPEALVGNAVVSFGDLMHPDDVAMERRETWAAIARDEPWTTTYRITTAAGATIWVWERGTAIRDRHGEVAALEGVIYDVTAAHEAEAHLESAALEWRRTVDAMRDSVAVFDREGRLLRCNSATTHITARDFADLVGRHCHEVFHGTYEFHPDCPQRRASVSGRAETSLLEQDGRWLRVTFEPQLDDSGRHCGGVHVVTEVTDLKEAEHQARESLTRLARTTDGVIAALSRSVEVRDAYTAGHQRRVSELSAAIAVELGLPAEDARRVRIAGMLHDVGKIIIPAEILAKPGRLADTEFALIKEHPRAAYEILESIEFDFPAADIVVQHHERLDGTGYPAGLRGDEIMPEARILAVADVVEAMVSHRPYRAALQLEAAVAEIEDGAGSRYDRAACQAAVRLLTEKGFDFGE